MDVLPIINTIAPIVVTALSAYIVKGLSVSHKYVYLAADAANFIKDLQSSLEDGSLTSDEQKKLAADAEQFVSDMKS